MSSNPDCLFCKIVAGEIPSDRLYEDDEILAFRDISPQAPFHGLLIPKIHLATLNDLRPENCRDWLAACSWWPRRWLRNTVCLPIVWW